MHQDDHERRGGSTSVTAASPVPSGDRTHETATGTVAVVGLGFAGLPTAVAIAQAGHRVVGLDLDASKTGAVNACRDVSGVPASILEPLVKGKTLTATTDPAVLVDADAIVINVPTPLGPSGRPDLSAVESAAGTVIAHMRPGTLIVLQSTVVPGVTRRLFVEPLAKAGWSIGRDVFVAYSPERVNPGDPVFRVSNTKKLVAGATPECLEKAVAFVASFVSAVHPVSALEVAELSKLVENTFRFVNIGFANEIAVLCDRLGISAWEVIAAAATKPFSFLAHYPGPGVGGECIPVSPRYLEESAREHGCALRIVPAAFEANDAMARHVADRCAAELGMDLAGRRILVVGVAYKPGIADSRHSPAVPLIRVLREQGAEVAILDPLVRSLDVDGVAYRTCDADGTWPHGPVGADAAIVVTAHGDVDHLALARRVGVVLDTRNALTADPDGHIVPM